MERGHVLLMLTAAKGIQCWQELHYWESYARDLWLWRQERIKLIRTLNKLQKSVLCLCVFIYIYIFMVPRALALKRSKTINGDNDRFRVFKKVSLLKLLRKNMWEEGVVWLDLHQSWFMDMKQEPSACNLTRGPWLRLSMQSKLGF